MIQRKSKPPPSAGNATPTQQGKGANRPPASLPKSFQKQFTFLVLLCVATVTWKYLQPNSTYATWLSRSGQCFFYASAGVAHFSPRMIPFYLAITPDFFGFKKAIIFLSGVIEVILGVLILVPPISNTVAWALILLLIAVFPANLTGLTRQVQAKTGLTTPIALIRLPIQLLFILWAYQLTTLSFEETVKNFSIYDEIHAVLQLRKTLV